MNTNIFIIIVLCLIVVFGVIYLWTPKSVNHQNENVNQPEEKSAPISDDAQKDADVFNIQIIQEGAGESAKAGDKLEVHYIGTLKDGTKFDSSRDGGEPFSFTLGAGQVIKGWEQGMIGMKVDEIRKLTIPADLGYGDRDMGTIPPNSTLIFEVELLKIN